VLLDPKAPDMRPKLREKLAFVAVANVCERAVKDEAARDIPKSLTLQTHLDVNVR
jgi:hypothetical protein